MLLSSGIDKVETNKFALPALYRPASVITEDIWRACPATTNVNEWQAHRNVNRDSVIPLMFTVHREASLVKSRHVTQTYPVVRPGADNGHQDAL
ncbi:hypothetical protein BDR03DRAFT_50641 [Suillus americanus]|nr:hypothetical protein BDR03DRAFT_50641 [Suillus americanus]